MVVDQYPEELKYSESHQWVRVIDDGNYALVGVTNYICDSYGEVGYIELPELEIQIDANEEIGLLEMANGNYELYSPISGEIVAVNDDLEESPKVINVDPYGDGWIYKMKLLDIEELDSLMSLEEYKEFLQNIIEE